MTMAGDAAGSLARGLGVAHLLEPRVVRVELHRRLGVRVVGGLELDVVKLGAEAAVEVGDGAHQVAEREVVADDEALDLMERTRRGEVTCR